MDLGDALRSEAERDSGAASPPGAPAVLSVAEADSGGWRPARTTSVSAPAWRREPATPSLVTDPGPAGQPGPAVRPEV